MNKNQKQVTAAQLKSEKEVIDELKQTYEDALEEIDEEIQRLMGPNFEMTQSKIYQLNYQYALKDQLNAILDKMNANQYQTVDQYIKNCYEDGWIGAFYNIKEVEDINTGDIIPNIPIVAPIDQEAVVQAVRLNSKLSKPLYESMGINTQDLKKSVSQELSRGLSSGLRYEDISRNINNQMNIGLNKSIRIARTEGHRVSSQATMDAMKKAKAKGADIVKQWDSTMDRKTRPSHQRVDGEIREMDEKFSNGLMYPGDPAGPAAEVVNCRCVLLQRARWALDEEELKMLQERAEYFGLDKSQSFEEFKKKYLEAANGPSVEQLKMVEKYEKQIKNAEKSMQKKQDEMEQALDLNAEYPDIWKDPVTLKDYPNKKAAISAKEVYLSTKYNEAKIDNHKIKMHKFEDLMNLLKEYDTNGKEYMKYYNQIEKYKDKINKLKHEINKIKGTISGKGLDLNCTYKDLFPTKEKADKVFRAWADQTTYSLGDNKGQKAIYQYTVGSGQFNRPLSGFEKNWQNFKGLGKVDLDAEGGKKLIEDLTKIIDDTEPLDYGVTLRRGSSKSGLIGLFKNAGFDEEEILNAINNGTLADFEGETILNTAFTSTGIAKGAGFPDLNIDYTIKCPAGTKMVYAEPQSYYGGTIGHSPYKAYKPGMSYEQVKREAEIIIQRDTYYRIDKIKKTRNGWNVEMTVVNQESH